jgi:hypothetical protein
MKPVLINGKLSVELNTLERRTLEKARVVGVLLDQLHQPDGAALVAAVNAVLSTDGPEEA